MNIGLASAAALSLLTALLHTFVAGKHVVRPLLRSADIHDVSKYTNYYCWHLVSIMLFAMTVAFGYASMNTGAFALAVCWAVIAVLSFIWSAILVTWKKQSYRLMPQWALFLSISVAALIGLF